MQATTASRRRIVTLATAIFATFIIGVAFAAWTATGTGDGYAEAAEGQSVYTDAVTASETLLYPGATAPLTVAVENPNPYPVRVTQINNRGTVDHPISTESGDEACDGSTGVIFTDQTVNRRIEAGASTTFTLNNALHMTNASATECQGETFVVPVEIVAASDAN